MKICFYSPYVPKHFGGGEKHFFDVASLVATRNQVFVAISETEKKSFKQIKDEYQNFLNYSLNNIQFIHSPIPTGKFLTKLLWTRQFDYFYYATDGSLFFSLAKKNNLHIQIPFRNKKLSVIERLKLKNWNIKNTNSLFTKKVIEKYWKTKINFVHNPKVNLEEIPFEFKKEKIILNVGRFFRQLHSKRQDVLVDIFKELTLKYPKLLKGWKLVLIGSVEDRSYFNEIKLKIGNLPVELHTNVERKKLINYYRKASIYWHATGCEVDEKLSPEKVEHFGITTIEAMAAGCIPIVVKKGGQVEILGHKLSQLLWSTKDQCIDKTIKVMDDIFDNLELRKAVLNRVKKFDQQTFEKKLWQMF